MSDEPLPALDAEHLSSMTGADVSLAIEVIDIFRQQTELWGRLLDASKPQNEWADAAHSLKGSALSVGAQHLAEVCAQAEKLGRSDVQVTVTQAAVAISSIKDAIGPAVEAAARLAHQLSVSGRFSAS
ncbi:MAG: Hpt domain-containing protein [Pseudomonadota bacterium]